jgi:hypothetical protein
VWKSPRGYHDIDRGYHDIDRGYHDIDRGYHDIDRGYHDIDSLYRDGQLYWCRKPEYHETNRPVASHWQTLSHNAVSSTPLHVQLLCDHDHDSALLIITYS